MGWWLVGVALAGLEVDDPAACLARESLALEVDQVLTGAGATAATVRVVRRGASVSVEVVDEGVTRWSRELPLAPEDCAVGHLLVARSVEQGLEALPDWSWDRESLARPPSASVALEGGLSVAPPPLAWGAVARIDGPLGGRARWQTGLGVQGARLRDGDRGAQLLSVLARLGPTVDLDRTGRWRVAGAVAAGAVFVAPQVPLQLAGPPVVPGLRGELGVAWIGGGWLWVEAWADTPLLRVQVNDVTTGAQLLEGAIRGGLRLGVQGALRGR